MPRHPDPPEVLKEADDETPSTSTAAPRRPPPSPVPRARHCNQN